MYKTRDLTTDQAFQELFARVQKLEAEAMADRAIIAMLIAVFSAIPAVGREAVSQELERISHYADNLPDPDSEQAEVLRAAFKAIPAEMQIKKPVDVRSMLRVIAGNKQATDPASIE